MLILGRCEGEKIVIGDGLDRIVVTVVQIDAGRVKIGFQAPRHVAIWREELLEREPAEEMTP